MMNQIILTIRFILKHKFKLVLVAVLSVLFVVLFFPYSDLSDYTTNLISKSTNGRVYVQFDEMKLNLLTQNVKVNNLFLDPGQKAPFKIQSLTVSPSFLALIQSKVGGELTAEGIMGGQVTTKIEPVSSAKNAKDDAPSGDTYKIELSAEKIRVDDLGQSLSFQVPIYGTANLKLNSVVDTGFTTQPDGDVNIVITNFLLPNSSLNLQQLGNINLPEIKMKNIELKGKLNNGKFLIQTGNFGSSGDDLTGSITGTLDISFKNQNQQVTFLMQGYNVSVDLTANMAFKDRAKFFLSFLDSYKSDTGSLSRYRFKIQSSSMEAPPQISRQ